MTTKSEQAIEITCSVNNKKCSSIQLSRSVLFNPSKDTSITSFFFLQGERSYTGMS